MTNHSQIKQSFINELTFFQNININYLQLFLNELYTNITICGKCEMDYFLFSEVTRLPIFISEKIFRRISRKKRILSKEIFVEGITNCIFFSKLEIVNFLFNVLDFTDLGFIEAYNCKLFFKHLHLVDYDYSTLPLLSEIINGFFTNHKMNYVQFKTKCLNDNFDIVMLFLFFFLIKFRFFKKEQIAFLEEINKTISNDKITISKKVDYIDMPITENLLNYISLYYNENYIESKLLTIDDGENDVEHNFLMLDEFEKDLHDVINTANLNKATLMHIQDEFCSDFMNDILINEEKQLIRNYKTFLRNDLNKIFSSNKAITTEIFPRERKYDSFFSNGHRYSPVNRLSSAKNFTLDSRKFSTNSLVSTNYPSQRTLILNDLIVYKLDNDKTTLTKHKLVVMDNILFMLKENAQHVNTFVYESILLLHSVFPKISNTTNIQGKEYFTLELISTYYHHKQIISLYVDSKEALDSFVDELNINNKCIENAYEIGNEIGKGKFGVVKLAINKKTKCEYAIKIIHKFSPEVTQENYRIFSWEKSIFTFLKNYPHPNIINSIDFYQTYDKAYFIMEYINKGDLRTFVLSPEMSVAHWLSFTYQLFNGLSFLEHNGIIHRDIKHSNILISQTNENSLGIIKIIDFGLSKVIGKNEKAIEPYGSLSFKAPEIILDLPYDGKVDVWSTGVTLYYLLFSEAPFYEHNRELLKKKIVGKEVSFTNTKKELIEKKYGITFTMLMCDIIKNCLIKDLSKRPRSKEFLENYFSNKKTKKNNTNISNTDYSITKINIAI